MQKPMVDNYFYKPRMHTARQLHKLYNQEYLNVPSVEDLILESIRIEKGFNAFMKDFIDNDTDSDVLELCMLIGVDYEDVEPMDFENGGLL